MIIKSYISENRRLVPIDVEVILLPGLPSIHILGLPDQSVKESALKIKSAIKLQGFEFPKAKQIIVNLRPNNIKKSSRGLDLAIVAAYLWESGQVQPFLEVEKMVVYGELTASGEVLAPDDVHLASIDKEKLLTGKSSGLPVSDCDYFSVNCLADLKFPTFVKNKCAFVSHRPQGYSNFTFSEQEAEIALMSSVGGHSLVLAGPAGSGKTSLVKVIHSLLAEFTSEDRKEIIYNFIDGVDDNQWWPMVAPHHTMPKISLIGGGSNLHSGEVSRAHKGVLLLDELLEFEPSVLESFREILETKTITISRNGKVKRQPFKALVAATTNLCPCGDWTPGKSRSSCRFSARKCGSTLNKLSGPLLDRFEVLHFTDRKRKSVLSFQDVLARAEKSRVFRREKDLSDHGSVVLKDELEHFTQDAKTYLQELIGRGLSHRRRLALIRVARTLADIELVTRVRFEHLIKAEKYCLLNFNRLNYE